MVSNVLSGPGGPSPALPDSTPAEVELYAACLRRIESESQPLPDKPEETPPAVLRALWFAAASQPRSLTAAQAGALPSLGESGAVKLNTLIERKIAGVPLAHLVGYQHFMELAFRATPQALIPRKETELLGWAALELLRERIDSGSIGQVIDVGTGSGNLAIALAYYEPRCAVCGIDISGEAIALARENAQRHPVQERVRFVVGDLFQSLGGDLIPAEADLVTCNPPYISTARVDKLPAEVRLYEPRLAFDGGGFGLDLVARLIRDTPRFLKSQGWLCFEVGRGQGEYLAACVKRNPAYSEVRELRDHAGALRALAARRQ